MGRQKKNKKDILLQIIVLAAVPVKRSARRIVSTLPLPLPSLYKRIACIAATVNLCVRKMPLFGEDKL